VKKVVSFFKKKTVPSPSVPPNVKSWLRACDLHVSTLVKMSTISSFRTVFVKVLHVQY